MIHGLSERRRLPRAGRIKLGIMVERGGKHQVPLTGADVGWLAGIIEGEGCILIDRKYPAIKIGMTDRDVMERVALLLHSAAGRTRKDIGPLMKVQRRPNRLEIYTTVVYGTRAIQWLMTLYGLFGQRRRARARQAIELWRLAKYNALIKRPRCHPNRRYLCLGLCYPCYKRKWRKLRQAAA